MAGLAGRSFCFVERVLHPLGGVGGHDGRQPLSVDRLGLGGVGRLPGFFSIAHALLFVGVYIYLNCRWMPMKIRTGLIVFAVLAASAVPIKNQLLYGVFRPAAGHR
ncbi:hypothetical protein GN316_15850 [Xylophilus sp. Kf1]|nr:hypothetical protein [Xylophilus sp. Kf1]